MQQTDKYKLNKPGVDDPIAIAPLNENADKIEAALSAKASAADVTDLNQRVVELEGHKVMIGSYTGDGTTRVIELGYNPKVMIIYAPYPLKLSILLQGYEKSGFGAYLAENGIRVTNGGDFNKNGGIYYYVTIV